MSMKPCAAVLSLVVIPAAPAAIPVSDTNPAYQQDFDTLPRVNGSDPVWTNDATLPGWHLHAGPLLDRTVAQLRVSTTSGSDRAHISYGINEAPDRALGSQAGSTHRYVPSLSIADGEIFGAVAVRFVNAGSEPLEGFSFLYAGEQWHVSSNANVAHRLRVEWAIGEPETAFNALVWQAFSAAEQGPLGVDFVSPTIAGGTTGNGNLAANRIAGLGATVLGLDWQPGRHLWLRWIDVNDPASDHGLAIDDFVFVALAPGIFADGFEDARPPADG
jgi:hypothetical protein